MARKFATFETPKEGYSIARGHSKAGFCVHAKREKRSVEGPSRTSPRFDLHRNFKHFKPDRVSIEVVGECLSFPDQSSRSVAMESRTPMECLTNRRARV